MLATPCARSRSRTGDPPARGMHHSSQPTPAKLNQNPADSTHSGSTSSIATAAIASACGIAIDRRVLRARATTAIISSVRTVGSEKPDAAA